MQPRRLVYITDGYTTHDRRFLAAMVEGGWEPTLLDVAAGDRTLDRRPFPVGVTQANWELPIAASAIAASATASHALRVALNAADPAIVVAGPVPTVGALAARAAEVPVVLMSWGSDLLVEAREDPAAGERAREALLAAYGLLADCSAVAKAAVAMGMEEGRVARFPWGIDLAENPWVPQQPSDVLRFVSLRSLEPPYKVATLIEAIAALPASTRSTISVTIASDGSCSDGLRRQVADDALDHIVSFVGRRPEHEIAPLLARNHIHVSTAPNDGSSISLLQAMAAGRPSIVVDNPSNREWVEHDVTGWLYPAGDRDALATVIGTLVSDPSPIGDVARRARCVIEARADWEQHKRTLWRVLDVASRAGD